MIDDIFRMFKICEKNFFFYEILNFSFIQIIVNCSSIVCNFIFRKTNDLCVQYECHNNKHSFCALTNYPYMQRNTRANILVKILPRNYV